MRFDSRQMPQRFSTGRICRFKTLFRFVGFPFPLANIAPPLGFPQASLCAASIACSRGVTGAGDLLRLVLTKVPVRRPDRQWWFRVHPEESWRLQAAVLEIKEDRETGKSRDCEQKGASVLQQALVLSRGRKLEA